MAYRESQQNSVRGENRENEAKKIECQVIYFSRGNNDSIYLKRAVIDLINYSKRYFSNWEAIAMARFTSCSQVQDLNEGFLTVFFQWYVINFRLHGDSSPIIDIYLSEYQERLEEPLKAAFAALCDSYVSIYQVLWIKNNAVAVKDVFCSKEFIIEKDPENNISQGAFFLSRMVNMNNQITVLGNPLIIPADQRDYLMESIRFWNSFKGVDFSESFISENTEVICGLVLDLYHDIKKIPVRVLSIAFKNTNYRKIINRIKANKNYAIIEKGNWTKFKKASSKGLFSRVYISFGIVIIVADDIGELFSLQKDIDAIIKKAYFAGENEWNEGLNISDQQEAKELFLEIVNDKNIEEWLISPNSELAGMTPIEALNTTYGLILLDKLLLDLEKQELSAVSRSEHFFPVELIRQRLSWGKEKIHKKLQTPTAIKIKVEQYRSAQEFSHYVVAYNWVDEDYKRIANLAFDLYFNNIAKRKKLALAIYIWNEYSSIYKPKVSDSKVWLAALESVTAEIMGEEIAHKHLAQKYSVKTRHIRRISKKLAGHFSIYPTNHELLEIRAYPKCQELAYDEKISFYEELEKHIKEYAFVTDRQYKRNHAQIRASFYKDINSSALIGKTGKIYNEFFRDYYIYDELHSTNSTITNEFWEDHARRFPSYLKTLTFNIMMSYVGVYKICSSGVNDFVFADIFDGSKKEVYIKPGSLSDKLVLGTVVITRLLPLDTKKWWVRDPMFISLQDMRELFESILDVLMEYNLYDMSDIRYLKQRGKNCIKAYCMAIDELEQRTRKLMEEPLCLNWQVAKIKENKTAVELLKNTRSFQLIREDGDISSFIWINQEPDANNQWGYLRIEKNQLFVMIPPGKDLERFTADVRWALKRTNMIVAFTEYRKEDRLKKLEYYFITDLAEFHNSNTELLLSLLRQDKIVDGENEWQEGIFIIKVSSLLMNCLQNNS